VGQTNVLEVTLRQNNENTALPVNNTNVAINSNNEMNNKKRKKKEKKN
jgi:hypothetical protein